MKRTKSLITIAAFSFWALWSVLALLVLDGSDASSDLILTYLGYLVFGGIVLWFGRRDILAPPTLFVFAGLLAFGLSTPLLLTASKRIQTSDSTFFELTDAGLQKTMVVFMLAQAGFLVGYLLNIHRFFPVKRVLSTQRKTRRVSIGVYLLLQAVVLVACVIRLRLHLGEAGAQSGIPFAGYIQYVLYDGVLLLCIWFLAQSLKQGRVYALLGLGLLTQLAVTQALLGWRGGIIQTIYCTFALFWFQDRYNSKPRSLAWLLLLGVLASTVIQLGNEIRSERLGGEKQFAKTPLEFIERITYRSQGVTRLAAVVEHFGDLTWTNGFLIREIYNKGLTTTTYIDRKLYAVSATQSHSVGTSGPGGPYTGMGMVGVLTAYLFLGAFYRSVYAQLVNGRHNNILAVTMYAYLIYTLSSLLSENFGINFLKAMIAVFGQMFVFKLLFLQTGGRFFTQARAPAAAAAPTEPAPLAGGALRPGNR